MVCAILLASLREGFVKQTARRVACLKKIATALRRLRFRVSDTKGVAQDVGKLRTLTVPPEPSLLSAYFEQREAMRRFFMARLGPGADVDDLIQDLYLKVAAAEGVAVVREPRAYLYRLATNLLMDRWRSGRRSAARDAAWLDVSRTSGPAGDIDDAPPADVVLAGRERLAALMAALSELPQKTQTIFRAHKFDGHSYAEVAKSLNISRSTVEKHMMEALRVLAARSRH